MLIAQETIRCGNVEIKKEWLIAKVRKTEITQRIEEGKKRYEALWLECKTRYESIPYVQKLLRARENADTLNTEIDGLDKQILALYEQMKTQREICINLDTKRSIELANFMVNEIPNTKKIIREKSESINDLTKQIEEISKEQNDIFKDSATNLVAEPQNVETNEKHVSVQDDDLNKSDDDFLVRLYFFTY